MNSDELKAEQAAVNERLQAQQNTYNVAEAELFRLGGEWRLLQRWLDRLEVKQPDGQPVEVKVAEEETPSE